jgi:hypothetical protein
MRRHLPDLRSALGFCGICSVGITKKGKASLMLSRDDSKVFANFLRKDLVDSALVFQELLLVITSKTFMGYRNVRSLAGGFKA